MTAEIVIMNKEAIALASDSAVTMIAHDGQKIFTSANKLFNLSKYAPIGIMVYGNANIMGVPWETLIKIYRTNLSDKKYNTLKKYAHDFISFLDNGNPLFPKSSQDSYLHNNVKSYFNLIKKDILEKLNSIIEDKGEITLKDMEIVTSLVICNHYFKWDMGELIPSMSQEQYIKTLKKYENNLDKITKEVFENIPLTKYLSNKLKRIAINLFFIFAEDVGIDESNISGVVIAGFGEKDVFPSLEWYEMVGIFNDKLKYRKKMSTKIDHKKSAIIIPFAQSEMVHIFMEGIDPKLSHIENTYMSQIFDEYSEMLVENLKKYNDNEKKDMGKKLKDINRKILNSFFTMISEFKHEEYIKPVTRVVTMLPKDELASMAESLVNLTSFKRKVSMERETVGGPIDVAVISKGDGFIWIKRKHYFDKELNPHFIANYNRGG